VRIQSSLGQPYLSRAEPAAMHPLSMSLHSPLI
jgi:hypothetical protein